MIKVVWLMIFDSRSDLAARYFSAVSRAVILSMSVRGFVFAAMLQLFHFLD